ncbi:MAG: superoxide dismutase [Ni], partial [Verrucomicrobiota bacterium]
MKSIKSTLLLICVLTPLLINPQWSQAHCQVPCGIYDDHARVQSMLEDADTVAKAASLLSELAGKSDPQSLNQ